MLVENNDPFDTVVYKGGNNGEGSEEGIEEQQQHRFQNPTPVQNNSQLTPVHISSWEKQDNNLVSLLL